MHGHRRVTSRLLATGVALVSAALAAPLAAQAPRPAPAPHDDGERILTLDHYVGMASAVPAARGQWEHIYVREKVKAGTVARGRVAADRVVIFVHGAGTPGEVGFDVPYQDYSWMGYLAQAGFDVFTLDFTGYGRSPRPAPMNDPCNLPEERRPAMATRAPCQPSYPHALTTIESDWAELGAVVDYVRALRGVEQVALIGWSLGGPRAGGYASRHPGKVRSLVLLAPSYNRAGATEPPAALPAPGVPFNTQTFEQFAANWDRQIGCTDQFDPAVRRVIWTDMLASDPVGATWGPGVRRAPQTTTWGWNAGVVGKLEMPALLISPAHDKQVAPERVRDLHADLGSPHKLLLDLGCASHLAMWDRNHALLFGASVEWLTKGTVAGVREGTVRLGYPGE